ncbi:hypothetical protein JZ751_026867 [Albula glossodonta]|uniref:Uncharacterized protein n=1 Tax=Albula glossodonta TaxID=121402 RepID=A0A8T2PH55_9TELE|nr:hypothetical protein JZ751_026867 [Albula glossodonta]
MQGFWAVRGQEQKDQGIEGVMGENDRITIVMSELDLRENLQEEYESLTHQRVQFNATFSSTVKVSPEFQVVLEEQEVCPWHLGEAL